MARETVASLSESLRELTGLVGSLVEAQAASVVQSNGSAPRKVSSVNWRIVRRDNTFRHGEGFEFAIVKVDADGNVVKNPGYIRDAEELAQFIDSASNLIG